jgi:hypothetical protein
MKEALLIGINYSNDENAQLYGCVNDVVAMKNMLLDAYAYSGNNITLLRDDENDATIRPTRNNILSKLRALADKSANLSELWIHYSGHGSYVNDTNRDENDQHDEVIVPCDYKENGFIVDDELRIILNSMKCLVYITMDCCHSGSIWDLPYTFPIHNNRIYRGLENRSGVQNRNVYMLSASRDSQTAADYFNFEAKIPMGSFTMGVMECLRNRHHNVSLLQLYIDIHNYMVKNQMTQRPVLSSSNHLPLYVRFERSGVVDHTQRVLSEQKKRTQTSSRVLRNTMKQIMQ